MRTIGNLDSEEAALRFADYLLVQGIEAEVESEDDGTCSIWVLEEEHLVRSAELLQRFRANPAAPEFREAGAQARKQRTVAEKTEQNRRSTVVDTARLGYERQFFGFAQVPLVLVVICVAIAIYSGLGNDRTALGPLKISEYHYDHGSDTSARITGPAPSIRQGFLPEVQAGQIWRLVTPIFLHFGILHIIFNMMWLRDFGTIVENRFGPLYLVVFILATGALSNVAQAIFEVSLTGFAWSGNPNFGGMSGVNYALFGFLWIRGRYDPGATWALHPNVIIMLLLWFVLCLTGQMGSIANTSHAVGLAAGAAWGFLSSGKVRFSR